MLTGFTDPVYSEAPPLREAWLAKTLSAGARIVLLHADWAAIAPQRPRHPASPADPAYRFGALDEQVRAATVHRLRVVIAVAGAPAWAEGRHRPASAPEGTWRPDAAAYGAFAAAIARRYDGHFPQDAELRRALPAVRYWQAWGEPNLNVHLTPQWVKRGGKWVAASPDIYRSLLNAFYAGVKRVDASDFVISAGTAPFGDPPGDERVPPQQFVRRLLCVHGEALRPVRCPHPAHLDALAHDPYDISGPFAHALDPGDVSVPDLGKLTSALRAAERDGRVLPRARKQLWVTEISWDSDPPDPHGVPAATQARWLQDALYELWREGADVVIWYLIRDQPPIPSYASTYQSGVYFHDGKPKPSLRAFRLPFVVLRARGATHVWTRAAAAGKLRIECRIEGVWRTIFTTRVYRNQVLWRALRAPACARMRAQLGRWTSLTGSSG